ncbi:5-(carboxyamino)imidazole ribonucleotide synthase [Tepidicella xavieri]|uniref:N5-carboxyaminoimidazole ribonucleotide synthase n=1 Tax=Tepidicella xavieri TaxID=360241 RepID=A0A4R6UML5_9BURK|nr:5-(carboxyamino)imidazole ribonucleotide synthase [Tepidicella xavieri]TDQ44474.1 5-(carboxyamino)imidazole ribonucleotide synthase [Tepidicella xavieri]
MSHKPVLPGQVTPNGQLATLGVMGGGQLGRMFVQAAQAMGYFTAVLDPDPASPAGLVCHYHIQTPYEDEQGLAQLMQRCEAITTEFENVPAPALMTLAAHRPVAPGAQAVAIAQDRIAEKAHFAACAQAGGVGPAPYAVIETAAQLQAVPESLLPGILKTARLGYDGKGQARVASRAELAAAWAQMGQVPCVLEQRLALKDELSVIVARGADGQMVHFPPQRNIHRDGILAVTEVFDGHLPTALAQQAIAATQAIAEQLHYVGVLCVEYFVIDDGSPQGALVVNEMAPRPHNSGHYTLNACDVSQFELQVRAMAGLPLVAPRQHSPAVMLNLLGDLWFDADGRGRTLDWPAILALPGTHLHLYGKLSARPGRKMGHLNITGATAQQVRATAQQAAEILGIAPWA